jgi:glycine/D-amino acid oxidase-like deaminating enzyme
MSSIVEKSFWHGTREYVPGPSLSGDLTVDVAIIGGGYTGLTSAYFLKQAEPGLRVAVLESDYVGFGASGRNGGFSMTKIGMLNSVTQLRFGRQRALEAHEYADRAVTHVRGLVQSLGLDCDYEHSGLLTVATSPAYAKRLDRELKVTHDLGITGVERLDARQVTDRLDSPVYTGDGWWEPNCGILNPAKLSWAWNDVVKRAGVQVYEYTPVTSVVRAGSGSLVTTPNGTVRATKVVFATNAWSRQFPHLASAQLPVWTYLVLTEPLTDAQMNAIGWAGREGVEDFRDLVHYYRLTADNRIAFGGRDVGLSQGPSMANDRNETIVAMLRADVRATFPQLGEIEFTHAWGGPVSCTLDLFPALGYAGGRDWVYSLGCVGHGVSTTQLNGQTIADLVCERDTELTNAFFVNRRVIPFPPGALAQPVIGGIARFMRWEDRRLDVMPA